jgi:hypothetical protein
LGVVRRDRGDMMGDLLGPGDCGVDRVDGVEIGSDQSSRCARRTPA